MEMIPFLLLFGILLAVVVLIVSACHHGKKSGDEFDERQQAERNKAYRCGYWFALGSMLAAMIVTVLYCKNTVADPKVLVLIFVSAIVVPVMAFYTYCAIKDALVGRWVSLKGEGILLLVVGVLQFLSAYLDRDLFTGKPEWYRIALGVCFVYLAGMHLLCHFHRERA